MCGYQQRREAEERGQGTGRAGTVWNVAPQFWHLLFHVPDIWIVLTQLLDVLLDLVFFLLPNDIGDVVYGWKEPVGVRALRTRR